MLENSNQPDQGHFLLVQKQYCIGQSGIECGVVSRAFDQVRSCSADATTLPRFQEWMPVRELD
jgi:hypothetical protein